MVFSLHLFRAYDVGNDAVFNAFGSVVTVTDDVNPLVAADFGDNAADFR